MPDLLLREDYLNNPRRKIPGRTKIVHLSDLHFVSWSDGEREDNLNALRDDICSQEPDAIFVTGDLIENDPHDRIFKTDGILKVFEKTKQFLIELCQDCRIEKQYGLFVVPGNHDFRFLGMKSKEADQKLFREVFDDVSKSRPVPSLGIIVCLFDSNVTDDWNLNFATGSVRESEILRLRNELANWKQQRDLNSKLILPAFENLRKVAILHHHPMPIPEAQGRKITEREELLLLKNAGVFMKEMSERGVEIILHGHRHYPGYSRAGFRFDDQDAVRYIGVLGAGTAGKPGHFFSYNILTMDDEGGIEAEHRWRQRAGRYRRMRDFSLLNDHEIRQNRRLNLLACSELAESTEERIETSVQTLFYSVHILPNGDAKWEIEYDGWRALGQRSVDSVGNSLQFLRANMPQCLEFKSPPKGPSLRWVTEEGEEDEGKNVIPGQIVFEPPLEESSIHASLPILITNCFFFDERDIETLTKKGGQSRTTEYLEAKMRYKVERLSICIKFPESFRPIKPSVQVFKDLTKSTLDKRETKYCENLLDHNNNTNVICLSVPNALPGYVYEVMWNLPKKAEIENLTRRERRIYRRIMDKLLQTSNASSQRIADSLRELHDKLVTSNEYKATRGNERFEISLLTFDESARSLRLVALAPCENGHYPSSHPIWNQEFYVGEGVAGQAIRRREPIAYSEYADTEGFPLFKPTRTCENAEAAKYSLVCSIPLLYPQDSGAMMGVMNFCTCSSLCGLHTILEDEDVLSSIYEHAYAHFGTEIAQILESPALIENFGKS